MKTIFAMQIAIVSVSAAVAQTRIGSWKFEETALSPDVYYITSSIGNDRDGSYSAIDFYCDKGNYKFNLIPDPNPRTGRNELPDGLWTVQISINNQSGVALLGKSQDGMISATIPKETMSALTSTRPRSPVPDVFTAMIEKIDGGRIQRAINYPATRFRAAINILTEACRTDR